MPKFRMAEHKRRRLIHLHTELEKIVNALDDINDNLRDSYEIKAEIEALEYAFIKQLAEIFNLLGADVGQVNLNPYGINMPGINVN